MRWKLLALVSVIAALSGVAIWSLVAIGFFGSARAMARNDWFFLSSLLVPIGATICGAFFVYRHTAHRRKSQAVLAVFATAVLTAAAYVAAASLFRSRLAIPAISELRRAR